MVGGQTENKIGIPTRRQFLSLIPFALFYAAAIILGDLEKAREMGALRSAGRFALCLCGGYAALVALCVLLSERDVIAAKIPFLAALHERRERPGRWYVYLVFAAVCLLGYLPYYLMYYPTWLNNDAVWQIEQALGMAERSNHHPYFHTLILKALFLAGYRLSGTYMGGAAFYTFVQIAVMAMVFAFFLYWLYREGTRWLWLVLALLFYAVLPINALLTICMGKDEFFTAALLVFAWMTAVLDPDAENVNDVGRMRRGRSAFGWMAYFAVGLLVCLLRSNGIFIFAGTALCLIFHKMRRQKGMKRKFPRRTFLCIACVFVCYLLWHGPVLRAMHVQPPDTIEGLTMPAQHLLCAYFKGGSLTEAEREMIERVMPPEGAEEYYNPRLFDPMKNYIREGGDQQAIADNKGEYLKLWLRVGLRNPLQYLVAQIRQTAGFWTYSVPDYEYVYGEYYTAENPLGIETQRKLFSYDSELAMHDYLMGFLDFYNRAWSLGLNTWLMVFCMAYAVYRGRNMMVFAPFVTLLLTLLLATPVYNEFRYAYGIFAAFPMLFHLTFGERAQAVQSCGEDGRIQGAVFTDGTDDEKMV